MKLANKPNAANLSKVSLPATLNPQKTKLKKTNTTKSCVIVLTFVKKEKKN